MERSEYTWSFIIDIFYKTIIYINSLDLTMFGDIMFKMPLEDIIAKINEKSGVSVEDINTKIDEKLKLLSGLISKEGAAHIVANELGIKLFEQTGGKLEIKNILAGMRDVETLGKVIRKNDVRTFTRKDGAEGKVGSMQIADSTGSIRVVFWGDKTDLIPKVNEGDIVKVVSGYVKENNGFKEIHMGDRAELVINPEGETIGEVKSDEGRPEASRKSIKSLSEKDINVELFGTIVQVFDLRFFEVCPTCKKRARMRDGSYACEEHGNVTPDYSYVLNVILDDGTETIRSVFFRENVEGLIGMGAAEVVALKDNVEKIDSMKNSLLGEQIKVVGRVNKNEMFNRLEFMVRSVDAKPDPKAEIDKLQNAV